MLPGKVYKPEDIVGILRKRVWWLLLPFAIISAGTAAVARFLPDLYRSDTLILVVPQRVPESFVKSTVTTPIEERLNSITQQILSRTRLERIIQDFNLYADERRTGIMEDIVEKMRRDIKIEIQRGDAFRVSYIGHEPRTVMKVADRLSSLFIEESLRDREVLAEGTDQFLEAQLEDVRRRLVDQEKKVEAYKRQFAGELPSQLESNQTALQNLAMQIQAVVESLNRDQERRNNLERLLAELEPQPDATGAANPPTSLPPAGTDPSAESSGTPALTGTTAQQLAVARAMLAGMQTTKKDDHPDVRRMKIVIRDLERKADAEALAAPVTPDPVRSLPAAELARRKRVQQIQQDLAELNVQITRKQADEKRLRETGGVYQHRVEMAPTRDAEMVELTRDYETVNKQYQSLLAKKEDSKIAANLERRQIGEQFKLLDQARLPEKPFSPNRQLINAFGIAAGLIIGIGLIGLLEYRDGSFKTDDEVANVLTLPVLAVVPLMQSDVDRRKVRRRRLLFGIGFGSTVAGCLAILIYTFVK